MTALRAGSGAKMQKGVTNFTRSSPVKITRKVSLAKSGFGSGVSVKFCAGEIMTKGRHRKFCGE
jgi:hypothetical protein